MITVNDPALYAQALTVLKAAVGSNYRGRAAQIFLACKYHGSAIPRVGSAIGIESGELQRLLDELYWKKSRTTDDKIAIIFANSHQVPGGNTAMGLGGPSNIWRNNLNLQKGFICYATPGELANPTFRNQSRALCPHLVPKGATQTLVEASCALKPTGRGGKPPRYRGEDNPKMFRKDPAGGEYTVHDPSDTAFYASFVRPANGNLIPIVALVIALYHDSDLAAGRHQISIGDFLADFAFTPTEAASYFEDDPASHGHQMLLAAHPTLAWQRILGAKPVPAASLPGSAPAPTAPKAVTVNKALAAVGSLGQSSSPPPPASSGWWSAQQAVRATLEKAGWVVLDASSQKGGCDFVITKGPTTKVVEVKSSVRQCNPVLTRSEHARAKHMGKDFVLAVVENYDPTKPAVIQWVEDPASLLLSKRAVIQFALPRSVWIQNTTSHP